MLAHPIFDGFIRLFIGLLIAFAAIGLAGCNDKQVKKERSDRPVLVETVHYIAASPERSFVGTVRPRIETDIGFRVSGKVAKRLVEVGQTVEIDQPLALPDQTRPEIAALTRHWPDWKRAEAVLCPVAEDGMICEGLRYTAEYGLMFVSPE